MIRCSASASLADNEIAQHAVASREDRLRKHITLLPAHFAIHASMAAFCISISCTFPHTPSTYVSETALHSVVG